MLTLVFGFLLRTHEVSAESLVFKFYSSAVKMKGEVTFKPGEPITLSSVDSAGKRGELIIFTHPPQEDVIQISFIFKRPPLKSQKGEITTRKNEMASLKVGSAGDGAFTQFEAKWVDEGP